MCQQEHEMIGKNYEETIAAMVGEKHSFYMKRFRKIEAGGLGGVTMLGLLWPLWFVYRKMYVEFLATVGILILLSVFNPFVFQWMSVFFTVIYMLSGRKLYYFSILRKLDENKLTGVRLHKDEQVDDLIGQMSGTSVVSVLIYIALAGVISIGLTYYLMS